MEREFELRTHHVGMFTDLSTKFLEYSGGLKPWELPEQDSYKLFQFAKSFAEKEMNMDATMRRYFENFIVESDSAEKDYGWVIDSIGTDPESYEKTLEGRTNFYVQLFVTLSKKENKIFLIDTMDDYCKACAIGNHCRKTNPDPGEFPMDLIYGNMIRSLFGKVRTESLGIDERGRMFVTPEFLFDSKLLKYMDIKVDKITSH